MNRTFAFAIVGSLMTMAFLSSCDTSTGSSSGGGSGDLVGTWKGINKSSDPGYSYIDTTTLTFTATGTYKALNHAREYDSTSKRLSYHVDSISGTYSTPGNGKLSITSSKGTTDVVNFWIVGSTLTTVDPTVTPPDTSVFTRQ